MVEPTKVATVLLSCVLLLMSVPTGQTALLETYDLVGEDTAADSVMPIATGANYPACGTGFSCPKFDITSLEMANDGDLLQIKLNMAAPYAGTTMIMYAVHFKVAGVAYLTCWTVQSAGTTTMSNDINENSLGCSRFTGETPVGPATRALGVEAGTDAQGRYFVRWEVPKESIDNAVELTDIVADVWSRSVATCCAANVAASQSQQMWNKADTGPDTGVWGYILGTKAPSLALNLTLEPNATTAGPGQQAKLNATLGLVGNGSANASLSLQGLPEGWDAPIFGENLTFDAENLTRLVNVTIQVPANATNQTLNLTLVAISLQAGNTSANLTLTIDTTLMSVTHAPSSPSGNATANETAVAKEAESGIPGPGILLGTAAVLAAMAVGRRRHR